MNKKVARLLFDFVAIFTFVALSWHGGVVGYIAARISEWWWKQ